MRIRNNLDSAWSKINAQRAAQTGQHMGLICNLQNFALVQRLGFCGSTKVQDSGDCHAAVAARNDEYEEQGFL